jgi:hypothetical protein
MAGRRCVSATSHPVWQRSLFFREDRAIDILEPLASAPHYTTQSCDKARSPAALTTKALAEQMRQSLKQPIIIDNISAADGSIGAGRAARARPDGYTIDLGVTSNHVLNGAIYSLT